MGSLDWMADALRAAGLTVVEYPDWRKRAAPGPFSPRAVMWHHDASGAGPSPGMAKLIAERGNGGTPPPLSQCWVNTAGVWTLCASGRANHAGLGRGWGRVAANQGNRDAIGIETDHTVGEPWPDAQLSSLRRGTRVLLDRLGAQAADALCGHLEYAPDRKIDPAGLHMPTERQTVATLNPEDDMPSVNQILMGEVWGTDPRTGQIEKHPLAEWLTVLAFRTRDIHQLVGPLTQALAAAVADPDITAEQLAQLLDTAVAEHTPTAEQIGQAAVSTLGPLVADAVERAVAEAAGRDNAELANLIVRHIGEALTPTPPPAA